MRRYVNTGIAVAILIALWFSFRGWNSHKSREEAAKSASKAAAKILPVASSHIQSFTLTSRDQKVVTCSREQKSWAIVKPVAVAADQSKIASFLESLTAATVNQVIADRPSNLKEFGLDPPQETIEVSTNSKPQQFALLLGDQTPTSDGIYAQVAGETRVFTLPDDMKTALEKSLFDLRDTRAVTLDTDQISLLQVKSGKQSYTLAKNPEGIWEVSLPPAVRADHFGAEGLVDDLQSLTMQSVVEEQKKNLTSYGSSSPALTIMMKTPGGSQTLVVGKKTPQGSYYAWNSGLTPVFTLDEGSISPFQKSASDFRDKNLFSWNMFDVKSFTVKSPKGQWTFEQQKNQWKETAPAAEPASSDDVSAFLSALRDLQASSFPAAKPGQINQFGFAKPSYTFKVTVGAKNQSEVVDVAQANGHTYARRVADALPSEISSSAMSSIEKAFAKIAK